LTALLASCEHLSSLVLPCRQVYWRAHRYIANVWPFWNRTQGADHIWTNTRDAGGCSNPWGSIWDQTRHSILLTNWGGVTGLGGVPAERCFDATRDLAIPGVLRPAVLAKSPFLPFHKRFPVVTQVGSHGTRPPHQMWGPHSIHGACLTPPMDPTCVRIDTARQPRRQPTRPLRSGPRVRHCCSFMALSAGRSDGPMARWPDSPMARWHDGPIARWPDGPIAR